VAEVLGETRYVVVGREVTKIHEEFLRGPAGAVLDGLRKRGVVKGEITLLIGKAEPENVATAACRPETVRRRVEQLMAEEKIDEKAALKRVAKERGVSKSQAYREWQRGQ
jgi:16S rRNA (cytidine1402-2'-O)-methyltransferase